jgi:hypothetical protein
MLAISFASAVSEAQTTNLAGSGDPFTFNFDENGNGLIDLRAGAGFQPNPGFLAPDPTQPGNPLVLMYSLPAPTVNGDVRIWEDSSETVLSDVLRFTDANGDLSGQDATLMIFYSLPDEGPPALADTGIPTALVPIDGGGTFEVGDNFQWAPGGVWDNVYNGISSVPEPGAAALLALGGVAWLWGRRRFVRRGGNQRRAGRGKPANRLGRFLLAVALLASIGVGKVNAATQQQVAEYVRINILGGSYGNVALWMTDTNLDQSYVARDADYGAVDEPFPFPDTWLVMIDDNPEADWGHGCRWVFVEDTLFTNTIPEEHNFYPTVWGGFGAGPEVDFAWAAVAGPVPPPPPTVPAALLPPAPTPAADNSCLHAVLIAGGVDASGNNPRYGNNLMAMYNSLRSCGYPKANIFVYYADGNALYGTANPAVAGTPIKDAAGNVLPVNGSATLANVRPTIQNLCKNLNPQRDILFIYTSNHGERRNCGSIVNAVTGQYKVCPSSYGADTVTDLRACDANANCAAAQPPGCLPGGNTCVGVDGLCMWGRNANGQLDPSVTYQPAAFQADTANASVCRLFVVMDQCYSGLFTYIATDGVHKNMAIYTSASRNQVSISSIAAQHSQYMVRWLMNPPNNPTTTTLAAMHADVVKNGGLTATPTSAEGTPGNGNYLIGTCCGLPYDPNDKWVQPPDTSTNGLDVRATEPKTLADDFLCTATGPITQVQIWGSWLFDLVPTNACFCLGIWSDVPAGPGSPSHPGQLLCYTCFDSTSYTASPYLNLGYPGVYTNGVYEEFFDPNLNLIIGQDNVIWQYTFNIPTNIACLQTAGTIYWLSVTADCFDTNQFRFGWKTSPIQFKDNAVFSDNQVNWGELIDPRTGVSLDLSFTVATPGPQTNNIQKWLQRPDLTPTGLDVLAGNAANYAGASTRLVADDFPCQVSGFVTAISIWGSWLNDLFDPNATFTVSFWDDVPALGNNPSHPGNLLWQWTFDNTAYVTTLVSSGIQEGFFDPSCPTMLRGTDTQVFEYDFNLPPPIAFYQTVSNIYWLSVESCNTHVGLFGWKTCILPDQFGDDAVWSWLTPPVWTPMVYLPGHPYAGQSLDMSFALGTFPVAPGDPPSGHAGVPRPVLSVQPSGNGNLTISWTSSGAILQSAPEITGPWTDISTATSPYVAPLDKPRCFYRVYVP